ncbi:hypothetical protein [Kribbella kalugense]|uniref:Alpha/beta hydrolase family protein n=1 Tax=Kribbella kalugense TaxID=2512221 RepID=A0A4R8A2J7_9ACTN|nr:hypothetical protein [Kribbella kalugense]TDW22390.1 hypothetical protein EV650_1227 [Kribbella kalugense]
MYDDVEESSFEVDRGFAGVLWQPPTDGTARPLVLLGHGGPFHGERAGESLSTTAYQQLIVAHGVELTERLWGGAVVS